MKMEAVYSQACYPLELNARQRAVNNHPGTRENHVRCFGKLDANGTETPMATEQSEEVICTYKPAGQPEEVICTYHERLFMDFLDSRHRHN